MDLYFYLSGTLFILTAFGVFENIFKMCKINRFFATIFFLISSILYLLPSVNIFGIYFNLNIFLYIFVGIFQLFKKSCLKNILGGVLVFFVTIAVLVCYSATGLLHDCIFVQPLFYVAMFVGSLLVCFCKSFSSMFLGSVFGSLAFELVTLDVQKYILDEVVFFDINIISYILISGILYCLVFAIFCYAKSYKMKRQQKNLIN